MSLSRRAVADRIATAEDSHDEDVARDSEEEDSATERHEHPLTATTPSGPALAHHLQNESSILTLVVSPQYIYAGTQDGEIVVWSLQSFELVARIQAHTRSVLCLFLSPDGKLLFSSAGDAIVNVWDPATLKRRYHIYSTYDVGDLFSLVYSPQFQTVYLGAQNTSIQWCSLKDVAQRPLPQPERHPDRRNHKFFGKADGTVSPTRALPTAGLNQGDVLEIEMSHIKQYAHFGYVYCMLLARGVTRKIAADQDALISAGGDGTIKIWRLGKDLSVGIEEVTCLGDDDGESVLSIAVDGQFLYSGKLEGVIELWDLETEQRLRVIQAHKGDVMTLQMGWGYLWSGGATGNSKVWTKLLVAILTHANRNTPRCSMASIEVRRWARSTGA